jgi:sugar/nucleoside kinase (ribokinase family)
MKLEKLIEGIITVVLATLIVVGGILLMAAGGAFVGWVVSFVFNDTILTTLRRFGVNTDGLQLWEVGATLGFVGGFFRTQVSKKS